VSSLRWNGSRPSLDRPLLVAHLEGWIDAGGAARLAIDTVIDECDAEPVAVFDDDTYIDFRARRPTMQLMEGRNTVIEWPHITVSAGRDLAGHDVLVLHGPEPDMAWHRFVDEVATLVREFDVSAMAHLGAYPFATPHTRPSRLSITTPSEDVLRRLPFLRSTLDVPAGVCSILERALHDDGVPTLGIWAQVPHYAASMASPAGAVALLDGLRTAIDLVVDGAEVRAEALAQRRRIDDLVAGNDEHRALISQLEQVHDASPGVAGEVEPPATPFRMVSAEELGKEVEEFLRDQE
jgi:hypothetical protein